MSESDELDGGASAATKVKKTSCKKTTVPQTYHMITWLEVPNNFKVVTGGAAQGPVVAGTKLKKIDGFGDLAKYMMREAGVV